MHDDSVDRIAARRPNLRDDDAAAAERRVERAVRVVAGEREVRLVRRRARREPGGDEHAVGLTRERARLVEEARDCGRDDAAGAERRIERAERVVAHEEEVGGASRSRAPGDDELAVRLQHDRLGPRGGADRRRHDAGDAEAGVERAVRLVARERDRVVRAIRAPSGGDEHAVGLEHEAGDDRRRRDRRRHDSVRPERGIEDARRRVAREREAERRPARRDDRAVRLDDGPAGERAGADRRRDLAAAAERRVERAGAGVRDRRAEKGSAERGSDLWG